MTRLFFAAAAVLALSGCSERQAAADAKQMNGRQLSAETERCARGGEQAAADPSCRAVRDENFDRFMGKDRKP
jgi:conjugative transfer region protein TrbK